MYHAIREKKLLLFFFVIEPYFCVAVLEVNSLCRPVWPPTQAYCLLTATSLRCFFSVLRVGLDFLVTAPPPPAIF